MPRNNRGFTLIELIVVIILVGIISVTAASRMIGRSGFDAMLARDQAISISRQIQVMGMNHPVSSQGEDPRHCLALVVMPSGIGSPACSSTNTSSRMITTDNDKVTISFMDGATTAIYFDMRGRPTVFGTDNAERLCRDDICVLTFTAGNGEQASMCINGEGYISDCTS
ncbi:prepilin-type N-terminal cleavage/methylation domain-containing protein [Photobacterium profundum]|uniref:prepilin-type N-terminal cleavage/methylation domain-containing protein n=1 Tax=Photobacterium profundum TaxID=74109 RepID=UPI003D101D77